MVHFPNPQRRLRTSDAVCRRVESGPEHDILFDAGGTDAGQLIFGEASTDRHERPQIWGMPICLKTLWIGPNVRRQFGPEDIDREWIMKNGRSIQQLMGGPMQGDHFSRATSLAGDHGWLIDARVKPSEPAFVKSNGRAEQPEGESGARPLHSETYRTTLLNCDNFRPRAKARS
jgi:hypothetical protein